ncbi:MAG: hypothetical protein AAB639_01820 [Patescibacteria group bacterium]
MAIIVPGILTNNEQDYEKRLARAEHVADLVQIDLVDGKFSPNITVGAHVIAKYPPACMLEVQLMVVYPINYTDDLSRLEYVSRIIFPFEIPGDVANVIYTIRKFGKQVGLSLNPETPVAAAGHFFDDIDLLLLLTGRPGYSGQKLSEATYARIKQAKNLNRELPVEIDIGVDYQNARKLAHSGADFLVSSSALYNAPDFRVAYEKMSKLAA